MKDIGKNLYSLNLDKDSEAYDIAQSPSADYDHQARHKIDNPQRLNYQ